MPWTAAATAAAFLGSTKKNSWTREVSSVSVQGTSETCARSGCGMVSPAVPAETVVPFTVKPVASWVGNRHCGPAELSTMPEAPAPAISTTGLLGRWNNAAAARLSSRVLGRSSFAA